MYFLLTNIKKYLRGEANFPGKSLSNLSLARSAIGPKITTGLGKPGCLRVTFSYAGNFDIDSDIHEESAKIHINTLSPFVGFGGGAYLMTDVKRMSAKGDFLKMPLKDRNCEVELYEDCRTRRLFSHCNCIPWEMSSFQVQLI